MNDYETDQCASEERYEHDIRADERARIVALLWAELTTDLTCATSVIRDYLIAVIEKGGADETSVASTGRGDDCANSDDPIPAPSVPTPMAAPPCLVDKGLDVANAPPAETLDLEAIRLQAPMTTVGLGYWERWQVTALLAEVELLRRECADLCQVLTEAQRPTPIQQAIDDLGARMRVPGYAARLAALEAIAEAARASFSSWSFDALRAALAALDALRSPPPAQHMAPPATAGSAQSEAADSEETIRARLGGG